MKKLFFLPLLAMLMMAATAPVTYTVDTNASNIAWTGYKVTGNHTGNIKLKSGSLQLTDGKLTGGYFEVDMNSMTSTDGSGDRLLGHLKSDDFFGTATYPVAKFTITRAIATDTKGNYKIIGNLTIKETTKEVKFNGNVAEANGAVAATGKLTIDRSEFNVKYGSGSFFDGLGDKTIYDEFDLQVSLVAKK